ncbi:uncharacterized protein LOC110986688 isoform X2 [Acanthaster planci]|uniref:Uncharacterized protein LOC110986688 isoform X2 n=1 Tax=Acanthaster planci TaxID=133434 RepID=A0A8B7ZMB2_ACAPL|nr:uncharacterized protein LOC110986688 isoform X2 [Acanthaster planci]
MDLQEQAASVHGSMQDLAEAWVAANAETSFRRNQQETVGPAASFPEDPSTSDTCQDVIAIPPAPEDQKLPSVSGQCQAPAARTSVVSASRKRKQASPQPCREAVDLVGTPPPAKTAVKEKITHEAKHGKMLPVHCSVETVDLPSTKEKESVVEGYAIVPSTLLLKELVRVALIKLDYTKDQIRNATGVIQVQNWKALPFSMITDDPQATVGQILGDLLSYITLKIKIASSRTAHFRTPSSAPSSSTPNPTPSQSPLQQLGLQPTLLGFPLKKSSAVAGQETLGSRGAQEIRLKLLQLLEKRGPTMLVSHGCPFSQGKYTKLIQPEKLQSFYQWYNIYNGLMDNTLVSAEKLDSVLPVKPSSRHWRRPRTLFDQRYELPRLMSWYRMNPRPSRAELEIYLAELNSSERRRNSHPLQYSSIAIWFKNARAKYRGARGLSPDSPEAERAPRTGKAPVGRIAEMGERRREAGNGPRQTYIQLGHSKVKTEGRSRLANQIRSPQKSADPIMRADSRGMTCIRTSLSNGHISTNNHAGTLLSTPDVSSLRIMSKVVSNSSGVEQAAITTPSSSAAASPQVTDIRKIASGFGIMLSPAVQDVVATERKLQPVENIKTEEPAQSSTMAASPHDPSTVLNLSNSKAAASTGNSTPATTHPTSATTLVVPSISMAPSNSMTSIRVPTTTMVHNSMSNGPTPSQSKHASLTDTQRGLSIPQQNSTQKNLGNRPTRKRFNIHPSLEVPKLQAWFCINPKPDRHTIEQFVAELNRTEFRKNQPKYDSRIVYVWFKNARAKYSRQKIKEGEESNADTSNLTLTYSKVIQL